MAGWHAYKFHFRQPAAISFNTWQNKKFALSDFQAAPNFATLHGPAQVSATRNVMSQRCAIPDAETLRCLVRPRVGGWGCWGCWGCTLFCPSPVGSSYASCCQTAVRVSCVTGKWKPEVCLVLDALVALSRIARSSQEVTGLYSCCCIP